VDGYGPLMGEVELALETLCWSFGGSLEDARRWIEEVGVEHLRALRSPSGGVESLLGLIPMGQWFGGRSVRMVGVAGVATRPEARGRGASTRLLGAALAELRAEGVALSALFPASTVLYRRSGYELAGSRFRHRVPARAIDVRDRELEVRPLGPDDTEAVVALQRAVARGANGNLDRGPFIWDRVRRRGGKETLGLGAFSGEHLEGYCYLGHRQGRDPTPYDLDVADAAALSDRGWRRILTLLRDHGSLGATIRWHGALHDPLGMLVEEQAHQLEEVSRWMLRIVDVERALTDRGYYRGLSGELHLELDDPALPANAGRWILSLSSGSPSVTRGGAGHLRCDVGTLAQLYTGFQSPTELARLGRLRAAEGALAFAEDTFRGPTPWMGEGF